MTFACAAQVHVQYPTLLEELLHGFLVILLWLALTSARLLLKAHEENVATVTLETTDRVGDTEVVVGGGCDVGVKWCVLNGGELEGDAYIEDDGRGEPGKKIWDLIMGVDEREGGY
ncbi:hypothetical protein F5888DRAFT_1633506 [Russula emetica]|nr:hypothetical protein F5888DRAFT_1633506 [Russula emetica]